MKEGCSQKELCPECGGRGKIKEDGERRSCWRCSKGGMIVVTTKRKKQHA
jgi:phage/plasmid primase-like uncharacterized protein